MKKRGSSRKRRKEILIKRKDAAELLEEIRYVLARGVTDNVNPKVRDIRDLLEKHGIPPLEACDGEAHSNPNIDNCGQCAPRWGWVGPFVKVT